MGTSTSQWAGAGTGAISGAEAGSAFGPWGTVIGGVVGGVAGFLGGAGTSKKVPYQPLDINSVISDARTQAQQNLSNSLSLEQQYMPGTSALRNSANQANLNAASGNTQAGGLLGSLLPGLSGSTVSPVVGQSMDSISKSLALGGKLDPDTQNAAAQAALQAGGAAGISGSGSARGLVARDLGLTSEQLLQFRQNQALQAGATQSGLSLQDLLGRTGAAQTAVNSGNQYALGLGNLMNQTALPQSGLSPESVASLYVAQNNAINQVNGYNAQISAQNANNGSNSIQSLLGLAGSSGIMGKLAGLFGGSSGKGAGLPDPTTD